MSAPDEVRVRFAPSPTGYWHPGNARTALFTWLFARHVGGTFVLRIEDTDRARNTPEAIDNLLESMRWLGMDWDEGPGVGGAYGPYFQSQRLPIYRQATEQLLSEGKAYYCFTTPEDLAAMREEQRARGVAAPKYDGRYRDYPLEEARRRIEAGERYVVRFRTEPGQDIVVHDVVRGDVAFSSDDLDDFVIVKGDGFPVYNFACVVDDAAMRISHVIRAEEHLSNTPRQILLYRAMGHGLPRFCHLPVVLNSQRKKLSKRDPGVRSILSYRDEGILPSAVMNYLALLGWSTGTEKELMTREELIEAFTLERVSPSPSVFDVRKLEHIGAEHLKIADTDDLVDQAVPFFAELGLCGNPCNDEERAIVRTAIDLLKTRAWNLRNLAESAVYLFREDYPLDPKGVSARLLKHEETPAALEAIADALERLASWDLESIEGAFRRASESGGFHTGNAIHAVRVAVTGSQKGPGLFECLQAVGQERVVARMRSVARRIRTGELTST